ncbi:replication protein A 70 kDa DNA-binding subunit B-like [Zea mays]|uniref:replication protein A 70 kDa DNA-binding subunit B-like n=1 Tax=Zea mays TaxID=4577 RepID=UPI0009AAC0A0|nr:replication protein A 70 kDa DNA-binding subunit B-like [Zea mays]|eukprot:XP_008650122.2 replication protein A 70 kDa DNA-binding subunit B-like [Zea mays]
MVLLDEEGNNIHATTYPPFIEKFRPLIKEGSVYNMTYFRVRASNSLYKPVLNDIMITFTNWAKLEQDIEIPPAFPTLTYSLTHIEQIHSRINHKDYYTDAIGIVTSVSNVSPHRSKGQQASSLKRNISICSARGASVNVVLWGAQATLFPGERIYEDGQNSPQIMLFVGTLVKKYADGLCLTGSSPCKWYINPSIPEAETLMSNARGDHKPVKWNATVTSSQLISPVAQEQKVSYIKYLYPFENKESISNKSKAGGIDVIGDST